MGNLINRNMGGNGAFTQQSAQGGNGMPDLKGMLQNPQVKQQIRQMYKIFNGDSNALMQNLIQNNPKLRNNPMLNTIMQSRNNPNGILGAFGLNQQDFADIINGK